MKIYIAVPESEKELANDWVKANADMQGGEDTFNVNITDGTDNFCMISLVDDGSQFVEDMKAHFPYTTVSPSNLTSSEQL